MNKNTTKKLSFVLNMIHNKLIKNINFISLYQVFKRLLRLTKAK